MILVVVRAPEVDINSYQALYQAHYTRPTIPGPVGLPTCNQLSSVHSSALISDKHLR